MFLYLLERISRYCAAFLSGSLAEFWLKPIFKTFRKTINHTESVWVANHLNAVLCRSMAGVSEVQVMQIVLQLVMRIVMQRSNSFFTLFKIYKYFRIIRVLLKLSLKLSCRFPKVSLLKTESKSEKWLKKHVRKRSSWPLVIRLFIVKHMISIQSILSIERISYRKFSFFLFIGDSQLVIWSKVKQVFEIHLVI